MFETNVECTIFWSLISTNSYFYLLSTSDVSELWESVLANVKAKVHLIHLKKPVISVDIILNE